MKNYRYDMIGADLDYNIHEQQNNTCNMVECHNWNEDWEPFGIYCSECGEYVLD